MNNIRLASVLKRSAFAFLSFLVASPAKTALATEVPHFLTDAQWLALDASTSLRECIEVGAVEMEATRRLGSLGFDTSADANAWTFIPGPDGPRFTSPRDEVFCKFADLGFEVPLVKLDTSSAQEIRSFDTIAIISIDRKSPGEPYLYKTLRSLFEELPQDVPVNVLVGNSDVTYVSPKELVARLGERNAARVHIFATPPEAELFLTKHFSRMGWATWNYGRALRSYRGKSHLLLLEDDVVFSQISLPVLERWTQAGIPPVMSLYNYYCELLPGASENPKETMKVLAYPARALDWEFARTQAMIYDASVARDIGNYLSVRIEKRPLDLMVDEWMRQHDIVLGFAQPSVVQHIGVESSGLGARHQSRCFNSVFGHSSDSPFKRLDR